LPWVRFVGRVQVERDRRRQRALVAVQQPLDAGGDREVDQLAEVGVGHAVLEPRERRLAGQRVAVGRPVGDHLEDRLVPQLVVVVAVLVAGDDAEHALADHGQQRLHAVGQRVGQARGQPLGEPPPLVELPHGQQAGVGRDLPDVLLDNHGRIGEKVERDLIVTLRRHAVLSCLV
jgi:hypothetical protein